MSRFADAANEEIAPGPQIAFSLRKRPESRPEAAPAPANQAAGGVRQQVALLADRVEAEGKLGAIGAELVQEERQASALAQAGASARGVSASAHPAQAPSLAAAPPAEPLPAAWTGITSAKEFASAPAPTRDLLNNTTGLGPSALTIQTNGGLLTGVAGDRLSKVIAPASESLALQPTSRYARTSDKTVASAASPLRGLAFLRLSDDSPKEKGMTGRADSYALKEAVGRVAKDAVGSAGSALSILQRFELRQEGELVILTDEDGSAYRGVVMPVAAQELAREAMKAGGPVPGESRVELAAGGAMDRDVGLGGATPLYRLRVSGTNRTLNELVSLSATLSSLEAMRNEVLGEQTASRARSAVRSAPAPAVAPPAASAPVAAARPAASPAPKASARQFFAFGRGVETNTLVLQGRLRLGTNAEQPIRAVRLP